MLRLILKISFFVEGFKFRTVTKLAIYNKNSKKVDKVMNLEVLVFSQTITNAVSRAMTIIDNILAKLKV